MRLNGQYLQRLLIFSELPFFDLKKEGIEGDEYLQSPNFYVFPTQVLLPYIDWCGDTLSIVNQINAACPGVVMSQRISPSFLTIK